jgi:CheY-like chemotaxis protein
MNETSTLRDARPTASGNERQIEILIADDDPVFRTLVSSRLVRCGGRLSLAEDGGAAWALVRDRCFDLAIIDFDMPDFDGINLARCLRTHPGTRHIAIIMCTARNDTASMEQAIAAGVSSFLIKPVNWSLFENHIRHLLEASRASKQFEIQFAELEAAVRRSCKTLHAHLADVRAQLSQSNSAGLTMALRAIESAEKEADRLLAACRNDENGKSAGSLVPSRNVA